MRHGRLFGGSGGGSSLDNAMDNAMDDCYFRRRCRRFRGVTATTNPILFVTGVKTGLFSPASYHLYRLPLAMVVGKKTSVTDINDDVRLSA